MLTCKQFKLPDVGEGLIEAEIVTWKVKAGDTVKVNDMIVEIETAKSLVELPCPFAGTVTELLVAEGETVAVGTPIIAVETGDAGAAPARLRRPRPRSAAPAEDLIPIPEGRRGGRARADRRAAPGGRTSVLVGYGPRTTEAKRRPRKGATPAGPSPAAAQVGVQHAFAPHATPAPDVSIDDAHAAGVPAASVVARSGQPSAGGSTCTVLAKPPVRKLAKDLGVDLGVGDADRAGGMITRADVEAPRPAGSRAGRGEQRRDAATAVRASARPGSRSRASGR